MPEAKAGVKVPALKVRLDRSALELATKVPGSPIAKSPNAKVEFVFPAKLTVACELVGVLVTPVPFGLAAQLGLRNLLMMNAAVSAPASMSPGGKMPVTV